MLFISVQVLPPGTLPNVQFEDVYGYVSVLQQAVQTLQLLSKVLQ